VRTTSIRTAAVCLALLTLAGCGSSYGGSAATGSSSSSAGGGAEGAVLATAAGDLGQIVVDSRGRTVYVFDKDTAGSGTSVCAGACAANWPAVTTDTAAPAVDGVSGDVGTITRDDGTMQVTLGGLPLYTFAGDSDAGQVAGQGVQGIWWVVDADGAKVTGAPSTSEPASRAPAVPGY
jgi:predicted lipoprotein with Yx(FWY)xxD motif